MEQRDKSLNENQIGLFSHGATEMSSARYCMEARRLRKSGRLAEAFHLLEQGLRAFPDSVELHHETGLVLNMTGETKKALESLERAVVLFSENMTLLTSIAALYKALGDQSKAISAYKVFLALEQLLKIIEGQGSAIPKTTSAAEPATPNPGGLDTMTSELRYQKDLLNSLEGVLEKVKAKKRE
jgi:tetratricopeptide (TPR) repeat protein